MRFYRALLHLYPSSFRAEYGEAMAAAFTASRAGSEGTVSAIATVWLALADVIPNASAVHLDILRRDLRHATRALRRTPGFILTATLVVALGVGANAAAFSLANFVLLRPLPFERPQQLVRLWESSDGYSQTELSGPNFRDWKTQSRSFSGMAAFTTLAMNLTGWGEPRRIDIVQMSWDMPKLLGVRPQLGRTFTPADTVAARAVLLSHDLWQTQFGADTRVLGRRIDLDGAPYVVIGVMPAEFRFPSRDTQIWMTLPFVGPDFADRSNNWIDAVARLADGVSVDQARADLAVVTARLARDYPKENHNTGATVTRMSDDLRPRSRLLLLVLCGASLCILLLACASLANLLLVRAAAREREIALRTALGAGRDRVVRTLATEALMVVAAGTLAGIAVAIATLPALARLVPTTLPIADRPSLDIPMLLFAAAVVAATGLSFGIIPALRGTRGSMDALRDGTRTSGGRRERLRSALVMAEVMASVALLISAGVLMRAMWRLRAENVGFRSESVLTLRTALPSPRYSDPRVRDRFYTDVLTGVRSIPGVLDAAYISGLPMVMRGGIWNVVLPGMPDVRNEGNSASLRFVTPHYFSTLGIPVTQGRDLGESDRAGAPLAAVVSESFAKQYWPREPALGKRFTVAFHERQVVGIVGDVHVRGLEIQSEPQVYLPDTQADSGYLSYYSPKDLVIRLASPATQVVPDVRRIVRNVDPLQPISDIRMLADVVADDTASRAAQLRVLEILAAIALLLATAGIHGLLSFTVSQRRQEIGVRMALGADPSSIVWSFVRQAALLAMGGAVPGLVVAYLAARSMQALLVGVAPSDPATVAVAACLCTAATILGCLRPAVNAARTDPISALRSD